MSHADRAYSTIPVVGKSKSEGHFKRKGKSDRQSQTCSRPLGWSPGRLLLAHHPIRRTLVRTVVIQHAEETGMITEEKCTKCQYCRGHRRTYNWPRSRESKHDRDYHDIAGLRLRLWATCIKWASEPRLLPSCSCTVCCNPQPGCSCMIKYSTRRMASEGYLADCEARPGADSELLGVSATAVLTISYSGSYDLG